MPLAKRALVADRAKTADKAKTADNANKLGGLTAAQVGSLAPPPNVYYKTATWTLAAGDEETSRRIAIRASTSSRAASTTLTGTRWPATRARAPTG